MAYDDPNLVQPADGGAQPPQASPDMVQPGPDAAEPAPQKLPKELLKIPAMQALMAGSPAAVSAPIKEFSKRDEAHTIVEHKGLLQKAGFGFYKSLSGHIGVLFNMLHVHPADIQAADRAGKLQVIAPPFDVVNHAVSKSGHNNPVLSRNAVPNGPATPTPQAPPQLGAGMAPGSVPAPAAPSVRPQPAGAQRALARARVQALNPGAPSSGPAPGAGRLLNQILKPVV